MSEFKPLGSTVLVESMKSGERKVGRIIIANDDGKEHGVRPRWAKVKYIGPEVELLKEGDWVLVDHGRWTREIKARGLEGDELRAIEYPESVLLVSEDEPEDDMVMNSTEHGKLRRF